MDPGRSKFEDREIEFVATGDVFLINGIRWKVYYVAARALYCERYTDRNTLYHTFKFRDHPTLYCEVERGPTH